MTALHDKTPARLFAIWMGAWLTLNGVAALLSNPDFTVGTGSSQLIGGGSIANNGWHGVFHLASGAIGLAVASSAARALAFTVALATHRYASVSPPRACAPSRAATARGR